MSIGDKKEPEPDKNAFFPIRPGFGKDGQSVVLFANYFELKIPSKSVYKYTMEVARRTAQPKEPEEEAPESSKQGPKRGSGEPTGRKLREILQAAFDSLKRENPDCVLVTEYKSQLISTKPLKVTSVTVILERNNSNGEEQADSSNNLFDITLNGPQDSLMEEFLQYTKTMTDKSDPDGREYPKFPTATDSIGIIMSFAPRSHDKMSTVGNARFFPFPNAQNSVPLGSNRGLLAVRGYFQSVRPATGRILVNTNVSHAAIREHGPVQQLLAKFGLGTRDGKSRPLTSADDSQLRKLSKWLSRMRVRYQVTVGKDKPRLIDQNKTIFALACKDDVRRNSKNPPKYLGKSRFGTPADTQFYLNKPAKSSTLQEGYVTVEHYYKQTYGVILDRNLPLLNYGTPDRHMLIPMELCTIIEGQAVSVKLTGQETTDMLNMSCRRPFVNATSIVTEGRAALGYENNPALAGFGIEVGKNLVTVPGRILKPPTLLYSARQTMVPTFGSWNLNNLKFAKKGRQIDKWAWAAIRPNGFLRQRADNTMAVFISTVIDSGVGIDRKALKLTSNMIDGRDDREVERNVADFLQECVTKQAQYVFFILPDEGTALYATVKTLADCQFGVHTTCMVQKKFLEGKVATSANIAMKVNLKMGGVNHQLDHSSPVGALKLAHTMIVGYDVTHPTNMVAGKENLPSLVGLVASIDKDLAQWPAVTWEQTSRQEMLNDKLTEVFMSRLTLWYSQNGYQYPNDIVIYRDGVSEGQFRQVLDVELPMIRKACAKVYPNGQKPRLAIIVSVKRNQTRFYPTAERDADRSRNVKCGTVVDRGVTQARTWDFFMVAHTALKGTAHPAHYTVVLDEIFNPPSATKVKTEGAADELQKLTHYLCYLFGRATKAVSVCPPAYYADIVCERARVHRPEFDNASDVASTVSGPSAAGAGSASRTVHSNLKDSMYYI